MDYKRYIDEKSSEDLAERANKLEDFRELISRMSYGGLLEAREDLDREIKLSETAQKEGFESPQETEDRLFRIRHGDLA